MPKKTLMLQKDLPILSETENPSKKRGESILTEEEEKLAYEYDRLEETLLVS